MIDWINQHATLLQVIASFGTLGVWIFYAQLLYTNFRQGRIPRIIITQKLAATPHARCMVTNMSTEAIFLQCVVAHLKTNYGHRTCSVTDHLDKKGETSNDLTTSHSQGPLQTGGHIDMGNIDAMVKLAFEAPMTRLSNEIKNDAEEEQPLKLKVYVVASYTYEKGEVGAKRTFLLERSEAGDGFIPYPTHVDTQQLRDRKSRRQMRMWLYKFL